MDVFDLFAKISLDTSGYESGLENASKTTYSFGEKLKNGLATAAKVGAAAIGAVTTASVAMGAGLVKAAGDAASYGDNIDKMSQKMGLSAEAYQEWDAIMQHSGTSIESLQSGMKTLANAVESGNDAFGRLGITQEQIASMNNEELFSATITALQNVENETERTYLAGQLLGRGATELGALLNTSAEDTEAMRQRVHELGGVMSDEAVKAAAAYQDSLQDMQTAFSGLSRGMVSDFLPSITTVMDGLTEVFSGNGESGISLISDGLSQFVDNISQSVPKMLELGSQILVNLSSAIVSNIPTLVESGTQTVIFFAQTIIENLPLLANSAIQIISQLASDISSNIPELIPVAISAVLELVDTLIFNADMLIDSAIAIIVALAEGLINSMPKLLEKAPEIVQKLVDAIITNAPKLLTAAVQLIVQLATGIIQNLPKIATAAANIVTTISNGIRKLPSMALSWGKDLIDNFVRGIKSKISTVTDAVSGVANKVKSFIGFSEPEEGPLSNFHTYAPDMMKLFADGIRDSAHLVQDQLDRSLDFDFGTAKVGFAAGSTNTPGNAWNGASGAVGNAMQPITIIVQSVLDGKVIGETAYNYSRNRERAYGV